MKVIKLVLSFIPGLFNFNNFIMTEKIIKKKLLSHTNFNTKNYQETRMSNFCHNNIEVNRKFRSTSNDSMN